MSNTRVNFKAWALVVAGIAGAVSGSQGSDRTGVTETCRALRSLPVTEAYSHGAVPPQAKPLLKDLKAGLRELIASIVNTVNLGPDASRQVRERIVSALKERGVIVGAEPDLDSELGYGYVADISTTMPLQHADLLAVTVTLSIPCGNDTSLYLFRHSDERWNMILVDEVTGYSEISGARGQFKFQVSPPAADGSFMVLSASVPPMVHFHVAPTAISPAEVRQQASAARLALVN